MPEFGCHGDQNAVPGSCQAKSILVAVGILCLTVSSEPGLGNLFFPWRQILLPFLTPPGIVSFAKPNVGWLTFEEQT